MHAATIAAISSPPGGGARALIRLSGPRAQEITRACCMRDAAPLELGERSVQRARLRDAHGEQPVIVFWMPGPHSFTGEDTAEWHVCGAAPLVSAALARALEHGAVLAEPGEFTRRAFLNGRIDLSRAEGVLALVAARNESERRAATALLLGGLSRRIGVLRERLADVRALCEASLDFEERETGGIARAELLAQTAAARADLEEALAWETARESPAGAPRAALVGRPNAGKSSLFNRLTEGRALVSEHAGTTRDALRRPWRLEHAEAELWDSAGTGAETTADSGEVEALARERAREVRRGADLWLWIVDAAALEARELRAEHAELTDGATAPPTLLVLAKADAAAARAVDELATTARVQLPGQIQAVVAVSAQTGAGIRELARAADELLAGGGAAGEIRELAARHREALAAARGWLGEAEELFAAGGRLDLAAHALARATDALDAIEGRTTPEDLLDRIFGRFCLGK